MTPPPFLRSREADRVAGLLRNSGLVLVHGPDAQESIEVVSAALNLRKGARAGIVDVDLCGSTEDLARGIVRGAADALVGDRRLLDVPEDRRSSAQQKRWLGARRSLGDAFDVLSAPRASNERDPAGDVSAAIAALATTGGSRPGRRVLALYGVDSLIDVPRSRFKDPGRLLWSLRSGAQAAKSVVLVLAGGPASVELVSGRDAAFLGWGRTVELRRLEEEELSPAISAEAALEGALARRIAQLSEGLPRVADRLIGRTKAAMGESRTVDPVDAAWRGLLREQASGLRTTARLIAGLHRAALPVCRALAAGQGPYRAAHSSEVTRALRLLHVRGVCESPSPRSWRLTDPLLAAWLCDDDTSVCQF
jgi:hypothetical protein